MQSVFDGRVRTQFSTLQRGTKLIAMSCLHALPPPDDPMLAGDSMQPSAASCRSKMGSRCACVGVQVQVSKGGAEEVDSKPSASASDMVSSLMGLRANPALVAAFLRTQPGISPHAQLAVSESKSPMYSLHRNKFLQSRSKCQAPE